MSQKEGHSPYRGIKKRLDRKRKHIEQVELERMIFELRQNKAINVWVKDVKDDHTPTKYFVVEFNLKDPMILKDFEEMVMMEMGMLL